MQQTCRDAAHIAEALNDHRTRIWTHSQMVQCFACYYHNTAPGRFKAALTPPNGQWLTSDNGGYRITPVHRVGIHHPGHNLRIGVHIRSRNITIRSDEDRNFGRITTAEPFEFATGERMWIADDTALCTTKRNA